MQVMGALKRLMPQTARREEKRRFFIIGTQKSGTTWLRDCFGAVVPTIKTEPYYVEMHEVVAKHLEFYAAKALGAELETVARDSAVAAYEALMKNFQADKSAFPCSNAIGNVRPDLHPFAVRIIKQHFPQARVIVITRDPRSVFVSLQHYLDHFRAGWSAEIDPDQFAAAWAHQNEQWLADEPHGMVKYEDLKNDFGRTLRSLFGRVGLDIDQRQMTDIESRVYSIEKLRPTQPEIFRNGITDEWRSLGNQAAVRQIEQIARPMMEKLGYAAGAL